MPEQYSESAYDGLMRHLVKSARRRWFVFILGLGLLAVLFVFAGMTRTPGARKNPYMVIASRVLAVFGAAMLARIVLLTREDGVPVLFLRAAGDGAWLADSLRLIEERFEVVPLSDVIAFIKEQRYVPRKGAAVVIGASSAGDLAAVNAALVGRDSASRIPVTLLLGETLVADVTAEGGLGPIPDGAAIGLRVGARETGSDAIRSRERALECLASAAGALEGAASVSATYAMLDDQEQVVPTTSGRVAGLKAFFGGDGLNRYGDRGELIRLMDVAEILAAGRARGVRLSTYAAMYRGNYLPYPVWLWLDLIAPMPRVGST